MVVALKGIRRVVRAAWGRPLLSVVRKRRWCVALIVVLNTLGEVGGERERSMAPLGRDWKPRGGW